MVFVLCVFILIFFQNILFSDGGKLELWNVKEAKNVFSVRAHEDAVTSLKVVCVCVCVCV